MLLEDGLEVEFYEKVRGWMEDVHFGNDLFSVPLAHSFEIQFLTSVYLYFKNTKRKTLAHLMRQVAPPNTLQNEKKSV